MCRLPPARHVTWLASRRTSEKGSGLLRRILHNQLQGGPCNWVLMNAAVIFTPRKGQGVCVPLHVDRSKMGGGTKVWS